MIAQGEIRGVTSNPTIFMNAITKSHDYDESLIPWRKLVRAPRKSSSSWRSRISRPQPICSGRSMSRRPAAMAMSAWKSARTWRTTRPATLDEAKRLWKRVDRPNLMIKIPATEAGLPAITEALAEGINVNVTLIFSRERYAEVMEAHLAGLEKRLAKGLPIDRVASVASFFVSRVDTNIDPRLQAMIDRQDPQADSRQQLAG